MQEMKEMWVQYMGWEEPWRRKWQPTQYSCLGNLVNRGTWRATVMGWKELDTTEHAHI